MSRMMNIVTILALLCGPSFADDCASGSPSCMLSKMEHEETSLLQVEKAVKTGKDRIEKKIKIQVNKTEHNATLQHERTEKTIAVHDKKAPQKLSIDKDVDTFSDLPSAPELAEGTSKEDSKVPVKDVNNNPDAPPSEEDLAEEIMKAKEEAKVAGNVLQEEESDGKDDAAPVDDNSASGVNNTLADEIEFQAGEQKEYVIPTVNKWLIVLLEALTLPALFGVDRCCMGQILLGVIKGVTLGGFFIWFLIDLLIIYWNAWTSQPNIAFLGFDANWEAGTEVPAFWIAIIAFILVFGAMIVSSICACIACIRAKASA